MNITNNLIVIIIVFITQSFQRSIAAMNLSRKPFHFVMQWNPCQNEIVS
jgi:hypothetical protein